MKLHKGYDGIDLRFGSEDGWHRRITVWVGGHARRPFIERCPTTTRLRQVRCGVSRLRVTFGWYARHDGTNGKVAS